MTVAGRFVYGDDAVGIEVCLADSLNQSPHGLSGPRTTKRDFRQSAEGGVPVTVKIPVPVRACKSGFVTVTSLVPGEASVVFRFKVI